MSLTSGLGDQVTLEAPTTCEWLCAGVGRRDRGHGCDEMGPRRVEARDSREHVGRLEVDWSDRSDERLGGNEQAGRPERVLCDIYDMGRVEPGKRYGEVWRRKIFICGDVLTIFGNEA